LEGLKPLCAILILLLLPTLHTQVDSYPPVFVFEEPSSELLVGDELQIKIRVVDESGINTDSIVLQLDNTVLSYRWENGCFVLAHVERLEEGWHFLKISARDTVGNLGSATYRFRAFFPERTVEILSENLIVHNNRVSLSLMIHNPKAETWEESLYLRLDGIENSVSISVPPRGIQVISASLPVKNVPPGIYTLSVLRQTGENISSRRVYLIRREGFPFLLLLPGAGAIVIATLILAKKRKPGEITTESTT
jgi:hypothetical protein